MGYYTTYRVEAVTGPTVDLEHFRENGGFDEVFSDYELTIQGLMDGYYDTMKWYDWRKDIAEFTKKWPNVLIELVGEGEEAGDMWKACARNGEVTTVTAKIVFDDPDISTLPLIDTQAQRKAELAERKAALEFELSETKKQLEALNG